MFVIRPLTMEQLHAQGIDEDILREYLSTLRGPVPENIIGQDWGVTHRDESKPAALRFSVPDNYKILINAEPSTSDEECTRLAVAVIQRALLLNNNLLTGNRHRIRDAVKALGNQAEFHFDTLVVRINHKLWLNLHHETKFVMGPKEYNDIRACWLYEFLESNFPESLAELFKEQLALQAEVYLSKFKGADVGVYLALDHRPMGVKVTVKIGELDKPGYVTRFNVIDCVHKNLTVNNVMQSLHEDFS